jgi:hypothetical protein
MTSTEGGPLRLLLDFADIAHPLALAALNRTVAGVSSSHLHLIPSEGDLRSRS